MSNILKKDYFDETLEFVSDYFLDEANNVAMLEGGHFNPLLGPSRFSYQSLSDALDFGSTLIRLFPNRLRLVLGILVDDLGMTSNAPPRHNTGQSYAPEHLPEEIRETLAASQIVKLERLLIGSERNAKNRVIDRLKQHIRAGDGSQEKIMVDRTDDAKRVLLRQDGQNNIHLATFKSHTATAHCPAIMGQHYADCFRTMHKRFPKAERLLIIDWSEMMDQWKVSGGSKTCVGLFQSK